MQWCNRDLIPIPEDRRTWTWQGFAGYWIITGVSNSSDWNTRLQKLLTF
jgi:NCS1 family nucleobase:cation symporter-1